MEPKEINCNTFRIVFGTGISEQGQRNLAHHEQDCATCAGFAEERRKMTATSEITCERYWEMDGSRERSEAEEAAYWKHYKTCSSCKDRSWERACELVAHIFKE